MRHALAELELVPMLVGEEIISARKPGAVCPEDRCPGQRGRSHGWPLLPFSTAHRGHDTGLGLGTAGFSEMEAPRGAVGNPRAKAQR